MAPAHTHVTNEYNYNNDELYASRKKCFSDI